LTIITAGIKVHDKKEVVWKHTMQQNVSIICPDGSGEAHINHELCTSIRGLMKDISNKVEVISR